MMNENIMDKVDEMFEEDEMFDLEEEDTMEQKAFNVGQTVAKVTSSKGFKIGKRILKLAVGAAAIGYAYKKGVECGSRSLEVSEDITFDDPEFEELDLMDDSKEETTEE